jgi:hypothetical protein
MARYVYLETGKATDTFNCRGEIGVEDELATFAFWMGQAGQRVYEAKKHIGKYDVPLEALTKAKARKIVGRSDRLRATIDI